MGRSAEELRKRNGPGTRTAAGSLRGGTARPDWPGLHIRTDQAKRLKDLERENARLKRLVAEAELDKAILGEAALGNFEPGEAEGGVEQVRDALGRRRCREHQACSVLGQSRSTQHRVAHVPEDEARLARRMVELAAENGRYGYRRVAALLRSEGFAVNHKRVSGGGVRVKLGSETAGDTRNDCVYELRAKMCRRQFRDGPEGEAAHPGDHRGHAVKHYRRWHLARTGYAESWCSMSRLALM